MVKKPRQYLSRDLTISENLARLRGQAGMTQEAVAVQLQLYGIVMSRSQFSDIERGQLNISISTLVALRTIYKCEYADFFKGLDEELLELQKKLEKSDS